MIKVVVAFIIVKGEGFVIHKSNGDSRKCRKAWNLRCIELCRFFVESNLPEEICYSRERNDGVVDIREGT